MHASSGHSNKLLCLEEDSLQLVPQFVSFLDNDLSLVDEPKLRVDDG
jgi:hypothetical protein